jgi:hypothetical protein
VPDPAARPVTGSPWGAVAPAGTDTALGLARRLGAYCWAEQRVFALLGGWAVEVDEPDVTLALAEHASHAAWRAQRWHELLPTAPPGPDALVDGPSAVAEALERVPPMAEAGSDGSSFDTIGRLAVAYRVLFPHLAAAMRAHLDWSSPVAEPEVGRILRLCLDDLLADWVAGERLLQARAHGPTEIERVHSVAGWLEQRIAAAGGILGPGTTGLRPAGGAT